MKQLLRRNFNLKLELNEFYSHIADIWIFDASQSYGEIHITPAVVERPSAVNLGRERNYTLTPGNYIIRVEVNGQIADNEVELFDDTVYTIGYKDQNKARLEAPALYSSAPLKGNVQYNSSHEYYTEPAVSISREESRIINNAKGNNGLLLFLRFPTANAYREIFKSESYWDKFSLEDHYGNIIVQFPDYCSVDMSNSGYIGLNIKVAPGMYFLKYAGNNPRMVPINIYKNWYTQFFMTVAAEPLFGSIRIFINRHKEFYPDDILNTYIDICLDKLQNNDFTLDATLLINIADGKFESPMLGILGAYIYLSGTETKNDNLFKIIVHNLQSEILRNSEESPDIWALNFLSYRHFGQTLPQAKKITFKGTPMLRMAYDEIRKAAAVYPWIIEENSLNDLIAERQVFDSPYNTFLPIDISAETYLPDSNHENDEQDADMVFYSGDFEGGHDNVTMESAFPPDGYIFDQPESLQDVLENTIAQKKDDIFWGEKKSSANPSLYKKLQLLSEDPASLGFAGINIVHEMLEDESVSDGQIARKYSLPLSTISRIKRQYGIDLPDQQSPPLGMA